MSDENYVINLGEFIFEDIEQDEYLRELHDNILMNYATRMLNIPNRRERSVDINDALRFADILSKSTHPTKADRHKMLAQEIITLLSETYDDHPAISLFAGSVFTNTGNPQGKKLVAENYKSSIALERLFSEFSKKYLTIPAEPHFQFLHAQKTIYDHLTDPYYSYSGPTSMGKSFIMRMFIKEQVMNGKKFNYALLVPSKALINEVNHKIIYNDMKEMLEKYNYRVVTSAGSLMLKEQHNFILVLTPERLLYILMSFPNLRLDYLFIDEAHKLSKAEKRSTFYYQVVSMLSNRKQQPHIIFASPNIPNPEVYLKTIPYVDTVNQRYTASSFSPVTQLKFLLSFNHRNVHVYNQYTDELSRIATFNGTMDFQTVLPLLSKNARGNQKQNIIYCSAKAKAVGFARDYAKSLCQKIDDEELRVLAKDIRQEVHGDYYLAEVITKGVAYHIGYLPADIRMRIEELFRKGSISTIFCTSTLLEGVNLPADNLFITNYSRLDNVDFRNLIGRVGRIEYNLYGNVFLVSLDDKIKEEKYIELLKEEVPEQKLSIESGLTGPQKKSVVEALLSGDIELSKHPNGQTEDNYALMRKFALILLRDIIKDRNSLVRQEFTKYLDESKETTIRDTFNNKPVKPDDDINISVDQTMNLNAEIAKGLSYPSINSEGNVDYEELMAFLEKLCNIFKWEKYEPKTLGKVSTYYQNENSKHGLLRWYAVVLMQWIQGYGLSNIMNKAIQYKVDNPRNAMYQNGKYFDYMDNQENRNLIIADVLGVIENTILFSISNYFLRFSNEYKRFHNVENFSNDWYEFVEYGTTNPLTIFLQRNGFSRETSTYIKQHQAEYVVFNQNRNVKLRTSLLTCGNISVCSETTDIQYNVPELFTEEVL